MIIWKSLAPKMLWEKLSKPESNLSLKYSIAFGDVMLFMILLSHTCYLMWFLFYSKLLALTLSLLFVILDSLLKSSFLSCTSLQAFSVQSFLEQGRWSVRAFPYNRERNLTRRKEYYHDATLPPLSQRHCIQESEQTVLIFSEVIGVTIFDSKLYWVYIFKNKIK